MHQFSFSKLFNLEYSPACPKVWAAVAVAGVGASASIYGASKSASASKNAANTAATASDRATDASLEAQREQLAYLKEVDAMPRQYREAALAKLNEIYNAPGGFAMPQGQMIDQAKQSPLYAAIMGNQQAGEEAILRNQSATGGLRSGTTQSNLAQYNTGLQNEALLQAYNEQKQNYAQGLQGLSGLANLPTQTSAISGVMGNMGTTSAAGAMNAGTIAAQGIQAQEQAWQQGLQGVSGAIGSGVNNYLYAKGKGII
jgi:hypothetical protein